MSYTVAENKEGKFDVKDCSGNVIATYNNIDDANELKNKHNNAPPTEPDTSPQIY